MHYWCQVRWNKPNVESFTIFSWNKLLTNYSDRKSYGKLVLWILQLVAGSVQVMNLNLIFRTRVRSSCEKISMEITIFCWSRIRNQHHSFSWFSFNSRCSFWATKPSLYNFSRWIILRKFMCIWLNLLFFILLTFRIERIFTYTYVFSRIARKFFEGDSRGSASAAIPQVVEGGSPQNAPPPKFFWKIALEKWKN